ncbi:hypothetical protein J1605_020664 [Eschrichtius robustus]|uniref:Uncharacterized protein n=1 Tax=Eschrichtius robustus TaxID=9764 RepID=A0AB34HL04_ESCRO|nr:hypothetical protein J1605_020664 [Eschrichtius robustus]
MGLVAPWHVGSSWTRARTPDAVYDLPCSSEDQLLEHAEGQSVACNGRCKFPFSSRAFLSFKFDHNAIMKILDL